MQNILLIGNGAREHAIAEAIVRSGYRPRLFACMKANNPGIASLSEKILMSSYGDLPAIVDFAAASRIELAVIRGWPEAGPSSDIKNGVAVAGWIHSALAIRPPAHKPRSMRLATLRDG